MRISPGQPLTDMPLVYVVTLTWNQREDTLACLASLERMSYPHYRLLVVDNGSTDGTVEAVRDSFPHVEVLVNADNLGFQGGFNAGIKRALEQNPDFVFIINNDTEVEPSILDCLVAAARSPDVGIAGPKIYYASEPTRIWSVGGRRHPWTYEMTDKGDNEIDCGRWEQLLERDYIVGCAMLLRRSLIQTVGVFDTGYHPIYYEDMDLCVRARQADYRLLLVPDARMWHKVSASGGGWGSPRERYLMARNSVRFFRKYVRGWRWLVVAPYRLGSAVKTTARLLRRGRRDSAAAYWRGLRDGLLTEGQSGER